MRPEPSFVAEGRLLSFRDESSRRGDSFLLFFFVCFCPDVELWREAFYKFIGGKSFYHAVFVQEGLYVRKVRVLVLTITEFRSLMGISVEENSNLLKTNERYYLCE